MCPHGWWRCGVITAAMLDPEVAEVAASEVSRNRLRRYAARAGRAQTVSVREVLASVAVPASISDRAHRDSGAGLSPAGSASRQ